MHKSHVLSAVDEIARNQPVHFHYKRGIVSMILLNAICEFSFLTRRFPASRDGYSGKAK
jgi:hypothetical protein